MAALKYKYDGINADGVKVKGEVEARHERHARRVLRTKGIKASRIEAPSAMDQDISVLLVEKGLVKGFGLLELNRFTKQLSTLINAGVPILEALEMLGQQEKNNAFKKVLLDISEDVRNGKTLHEAMQVQSGFDDLYCALVKAGEAAGILDTVLDKLSEFMEKREAIKKKIKGAMTYPTIVLIVGIGVVTGLMIFVVPQFVGMLKESNQEIPGITQFVIDTSNFFQNYIGHMIVVSTIAIILFKKWKVSKEGKPIWDRFAMNTPVFGNIIIKGSLASFSRTLATMLGAGVPIIDSLDICVDTIDNYQMTKDIRRVRDAVIRGKSITDPLARISYFPPLVNQMMKVGESTGNLDQMLLKVAEVFEQQTNEAIETMTKLIEPAILVVLGGMVAVVLLAMYLPIFMSAGGV